MEWLQVAIATNSAGIDPVCGRLLDLGIGGFEIEDEADFKTFLEENRAAWDYVDDALLQEKSGETKVKIYLSSPDQLDAVRLALEPLRDQGFGRLALELVTVQEEDWAENWKQFFHPLKIGERVLVQPEWEPLADAEGRVVFTIDPGMSFGTGGHHTTQLCIEAIERSLKPNDTVLDIGCGSGILSIIALLLGAKSAFAIDIDPMAVKIAYENAKKNGVTGFTAAAGNILSDTALRASLVPADLVVANIVADVIIPLAPMVPALLCENGTFIASGVIAPRADEVCAALRKHLTVREVYEKNDWVSIVCTK